MAAVLVCFVWVSPAVAAPARSEQGWWIGLQAGWGPVDGQVRVGEPSPSTPLGLGDDLGIDSAWVYSLDVSGTAGAKNRLAFKAESLSMSGSETFDKTVTFDEGSFPPGSSPKADPRFYLFDAEYVRLFGDMSRTSHWFLTAGLVHAYLDFRLGDQSEDFYRQEVPMPLLGGGWELTTAHGWLQGAAKGFQYNHLNTGEKEGSTVYLDQSMVDVWAGWIGSISPRVRYSAGYRFFSFSQTENSSEDYNDFHCHLNALTASLSFRF